MTELEEKNKLLEEMESLSRISQSLTKKCINYQKEIKELKEFIKKLSTQYPFELADEERLEEILKEKL